MTCMARHTIHYPGGILQDYLYLIEIAILKGKNIITLPWPGEMSRLMCKFF